MLFGIRTNSIVTGTRFLSLAVAATLLSCSTAWCSGGIQLCTEKGPRGGSHRRRGPTARLPDARATATTASASAPPHAAAPSPDASEHSHTLHLVSLPSTDDTHARPGEALLRECWRWKTAALGERSANDVPRPRALAAFQAPVVGTTATVRVGGGGAETEVVLRAPSRDGEDGPVALHCRLPSSSPRPRPPSGEDPFARTFVVEECAALSTCARLDVLLVLRTVRRESRRPWDDARAREAADAAARCVVARRLREQIAPERAKQENALFLQCLELAARLGGESGPTAPRVMPSALPPCLSEAQEVPQSGAAMITQPRSLALLPPPRKEISSVTRGNSREQTEESAEVCKLGQRLTSLAGVHAISTHLSLVAAGLAPFPAKPEREVLFRPYVAADAHILFQLKRTVEALSVAVASNGAADGDRRQSGTPGHGRGRIKNLLDGALRAGKAARNKDVVPEILLLQGFRGNDDMPPAALAAVAAKVRARSSHHSRYGCSVTLPRGFNLTPGLRPSSRPRRTAGRRRGRRRLHPPRPRARPSWPPWTTERRHGSQGCVGASTLL